MCRFSSAWISWHSSASAHDTESKIYATSCRADDLVSVWVAALAFAQRTRAALRATRWRCSGVIFFILAAFPNLLSATAWMFFAMVGIYTTITSRVANEILSLGKKISEEGNFLPFECKRMPPLYSLSTQVSAAIHAVAVKRLG